MVDYLVFLEFSLNGSWGLQRFEQCVDIESEAEVSMLNLLKKGRKKNKEEVRAKAIEEYSKRARPRFYE